MNNILYVVALVLLIGWALGAFAFAAGSVIHLLLVLAIIAVVVGAMKRTRTVR